MDDPLLPTIPPAVEPPPPPPPPPRVKPEIIAAIVVIVLGALGLLGWRLLSNQPNAPVVVEKPTPTPTPTPVRLPSALATQSAFLELEANVASLSSSIKNYVVDDPSLSPPVLELPLGFQ